MTGQLSFCPSIIEKVLPPQNCTEESHRQPDGAMEGPFHDLSLRPGLREADAESGVLRCSSGVSPWEQKGADTAWRGR